MGAMASRLYQRETIVDNYDLKTICLPKHLELIQTLAAGKRPQVEAA
jgi:hypothetical protein